MHNIGNIRNIMKNTMKYVPLSIILKSFRIFLSFIRYDSQLRLNYLFNLVRLSKCTQVLLKELRFVSRPLFQRVFVFCHWVVSKKAWQDIKAVLIADKIIDYMGGGGILWNFPLRAKFI